MKYLLCLTVISRDEDGEEDEITTPLILKEYSTEEESKEEGFKIYKSVKKGELL